MYKATIDIGTSHSVRKNEIIDGIKKGTIEIELLLTENILLIGTLNKYNPAMCIGEKITTNRLIINE